MTNTRQKSEIAKSLRELTAAYVTTLNHYERLLVQLRDQLGLDDAISLLGELRGEPPARSPELTDCPVVDVRSFCVIYRGRRCQLGNTLPFWFLAHLAQHLNHYVSHEELLADVWHLENRSNEAIRSVVQILRHKLVTAGLSELAAAIDGQNRGHYGLMLARSV